MSILITDMEMPKNCYGCPFFTQFDYWNKNNEADILSKCKRTGEFTWESVNGYLPNCPLGPVPPHGDLVDRDEMFVEFVVEGQKSTRYKVGEKWELNGEEIRRVIQRLPTIIPAEPAEEVET